MIRDPSWSGKKAPTKEELEEEKKNPKKATSTDELRKKLREIRMKNDLMKKGKK